MKKQTPTQRIDELESHVVALTVHIQAMQQRLDELEAKPTAPAPKARGERDYGPDSQRQMDERGALRILIGRYRTWSVRKIADECGYSRGQIYSLKGEYTMKTAWKTARAIEARRAAKA